MTKQNNNWEEEFDERFGIEQPLYFEKRGEKNIVYPTNSFKSFIRQNFISKEELREWVEEKLDNLECGGENGCGGKPPFDVKSSIFCGGTINSHGRLNGKYQALKDLIKKLNE